MNTVVWSDLSGYGSNTLHLFDKIEATSEDGGTGKEIFNWSVEEYDPGHFVLNYLTDSDVDYDTNMILNCYSTIYSSDKAVCKISIEPDLANSRSYNSYRIAYPKLNGRYINTKIVPSLGTSVSDYPVSAFNTHLHPQYYDDTTKGNQYTYSNYIGSSSSGRYVNDLGRIVNNYDSSNLYTGATSGNFSGSLLDPFECIDF